MHEILIIQGEIKNLVYFCHYLCLNRGIDEKKNFLGIANYSCHNIVNFGIMWILCYE